MTKKLGQIAALLLFFLFGFAIDVLQAQDTLPQFSAVRRAGNRVVISWTNPYGNSIRQLSVQRSNDSTRMFKSIVTLPDPKVLKNGYVDTKAPDTLQYYRLYILLDSGRYIFSKSQRPGRFVPPPVAEKVPPEKPMAEKPKTTTPPASNRNTTPTKPATDSLKTKTQPVIIDNKKEDKPTPPPVKVQEIIPEKIYFIKRADTLKGRLPESGMKAFRDSINTNTKDTLLSVVNDTILIRPFVPKEVFRLSRYVFTDKSGLLHIELPEATRKTYRLRFYEEDKTFLFEVRDIRDQVLLLDKANFQHAGWFLFELFENEVVIEKNRFFIGKDF